jgi:hypothetical protein
VDFMMDACRQKMIKWLQTPFLLLKLNFDALKNNFIGMPIMSIFKKIMVLEQVLFYINLSELSVESSRIAILVNFQSISSYFKFFYKFITRLARKFHAGYDISGN